MKKLKLYKSKKTIELLSVNSINISLLTLINLYPNDCIFHNKSGFITATTKMFLSIGLLTVNFAYTNYNIYESKKIENSIKDRSITKK